MERKKYNLVRLTKSQAFTDRKIRAGAIAKVIKIQPSGKHHVQFMGDKPGKVRVVPTSALINWKPPPRTKLVQLLESHTFDDRKILAGAVAELVRRQPSGEHHVQFMDDQPGKIRIVPRAKLETNWKPPPSDTDWKPWP
jgi:hypothetical protein